MNRQLSFTAPYPPYYDYFSSKQSYHKILFNSGKNINSSHLNLIQTILQEQLGRFGQHTFVNGSFVTGGQYVQIRDATILDIVDLKSQELDYIKTLVGQWYFEETDTPIEILSIDSEKEKSPEVHKLVLSKETLVDLEKDKHYTIINSNYPSVKLTIKKAPEFQYIVFDEGVLFVNGYFISTPKQYAVIRYASSSVGFLLDQNIVSYFEDTSLLDNSQKDLGSLEGADRLKLQLELASFSIPKIKTNYNLARGSFFEFLRLDNWEVIKDLSKTQYAKSFSQMIERRTYDKSGSYTINPFKINIKEDTDLDFKIEISPGKAYVGGYEFDSLRQSSISLHRTNEYLLDQSNTLSSPNLPYIETSVLEKFIPITTDVSVKLIKENVEIGSGSIGYIKQSSGKIRLYLSSFLLESGFKLSDVTDINDTNDELIATVFAVIIPSELSRLVTLNPDEKIADVFKLEDVKVQRTFTSVSNNVITFSSGDTPPTSLENYIAFDSQGIGCLIDDIEVEGQNVSIMTTSLIDKVVVSGVLLTLNRTVPIEMSVTLSVPFSTIIPIPYLVKKVESATNNQETITSQFSVSASETSVRREGSVLTYTGSQTRSGSILLKLLITDFGNDNVILDSTTLDFRQSAYYNFPLIEPNSPIKLYYNVIQSRYDKLILTDKGDFDFIRGDPHPYKPLIPKDRIDAMSLYTLYIPGNNKSPEDIGIKYIENQRYTMRDIGKLEKRIENLEYYNLLTLLEKDTTDRNYTDENGFNRFKNGFMVDNFKNYKGTDYQSPDCLFSLDLQNGILRPPFSVHSSGVQIGLDSPPVLSCTYDESIIIDQNQASSTLNLNPYEVFTWEGRVTLDPPLDYWCDTTVAPEVNKMDHTGEFDVYATFKDKGFTSEWGVWDTKILDITKDDLKKGTTANFSDVEAPTTKKLWTPEVDPSASPDLVAKYNLWVSSNFSQGFSKTTPDGYITGKPAILLDFKGSKEQKSADLVKFGSSSILESSLGTTVRETGFASFIREQDIKFNAVGLKPSTEYFITFSDDDVTELCFLGGETETSGNLYSDSNGKLFGTFKLPAGRYKNGQHSFKVVDTQSKNSAQISSFAITEFTANGMTSYVQESIISTREPQTTTESVSFITNPISSFDTSALQSQKTITLNQVGNGLVELYDSISDIPLLTAIPGSSVYFTSETGRNYIVKITETSQRFDVATGLDYYDISQRKGTRQGSFLFEKDLTIEIKFKEAPEVLQLEIKLDEYVSVLEVDEIPPTYKVTVNQFPDYTDKVTYIQYRSASSTVTYPEDITFPFSKYQTTTDTLLLAEEDSIKIELVIPEGGYPAVNKSSQKIKDQLLLWDSYKDLEVSKTISVKDFEKVKKIDGMNSINYLYLSYDKFSGLYVGAKTNSDSLVGILECYSDKNNLTTPKQQSGINPKYSHQFEVVKIFNELVSASPTTYLVVHIDASLKSDITFASFYVNNNNEMTALPVDSLSSGYGIDISPVPTRNNLKSIFLDFNYKPTATPIPTPTVTGTQVFPSTGSLQKVSYNLVSPGVLRCLVAPILETPIPLVGTGELVTFTFTNNTGVNPSSGFSISNIIYSNALANTVIPENDKPNLSILESRPSSNTVSTKIMFENNETVVSLNFDILFDSTTFTLGVIGGGGGVGGGGVGGGGELPSNLISFQDDLPISDSLDNYPIDPERICTMTLELPRSFLSTDFDVSGILFFNDIDAATIIKDGSFTYPLDADARKAALTTVKFDCPFNTRIKIELKMSRSKPYNLTLSHNLSGQPFMRDTVKEYRRPHFSREGTFLVTQRNQLVTFNITPVIRTTCIPSQAQRTSLVAVPMVIQYADFQNQTLMINGVNLENIFENFEKSPFAFRTLDIFIGDRNYVANFHSMITYAYPGSNQKPEVYGDPYLQTNPGKQVFVIWYVPYNSTITFSSPFNPSEPAYILSPVSTNQGPYTYTYTEFVRTLGTLTENYNLNTFKFYRNDSQKTFTGLYSKGTEERKSEYIITKEKGFLFGFNPLHVIDSQNFSTFEGDEPSSESSSSKYKVLFFPAIDFAQTSYGKIHFFYDSYENNQYSVIESKDKIPDVILPSKYPSEFVMTSIEMIKAYLRKCYDQTLTVPSKIPAYYKIIKILDPSYVGASKYFIKRFTVTKLAARDGTLVETVDLGSNYSSYIQTNGFVASTWTRTAYNEMLKSKINIYKKIDEIFASIPTSAANTTGQVDGNQTQNGATKQDTQGNTYTFKDGAWLWNGTVTSTTVPISTSLKNGTTKVENGVTYTYINGAWLGNWSGTIPPDPTSSSTLPQSVDPSILANVFTENGTKAPKDGDTVTYNGKSYTWSNGRILENNNNLTSGKTGNELLYVPKLTLNGKSNSFSPSYYGSRKFASSLDRYFIADGNGTFYTSDITYFNQYLTLLKDKKLNLNYQIVAIEKAVPTNLYFIKEVLNTSTNVQSILSTMFIFPSSTDLQGFTQLTSTILSTGTSKPKVCLTDPLAQSFFIDDSTYPEGVVVSSIDLFFKTKDDKIPVMLELRPSVNGYPSSKEVIPFSRCFKEAKDIEISEDALTPTKFKFEGLVYLKPGEYHFVVISRSINYTVWVGRLGEFVLGDDTKGRIDKNPYAGVLFKSSNNTAWLPDSEADFTFRLNRCKFSVGETTYQFSSNTYRSKARTAQPLEFTAIKPAFSTFLPEGSKISKSVVSLMNKDSLTTKDFNIPLNDNFDLDGVYTISDTKFDSTNRIVHSITLTTSKDHVSPLIDWQKSSYVLVNNLINSLGTSDITELQTYGGAAKARYITKPMKLNLEIPANNLRLEFAANAPGATSVKVYYRVFNTLHDSNGLSIVDKNWVYLGSASKIPKDKNTFIDFAFESPNPITYQGITNLTEFDVCQVKLVLDSTNPALVPRVKDFRLIALSS